MSAYIGVFLYDGVELLDFAGPVEVFATAERVARRRAAVDEEPPLTVATVSRQARPIKTRGGPAVIADYAFETAPDFDVLVLPGGEVTTELREPESLAWIAVSSYRARITASVCTGVFLLAKAGLLSGRTVTTHWEDIADLRQSYPDIKVVENRRWVEDETIISSAGISAGIDMSLRLVELLAGRELAEATARQMDYAWSSRP